MATNVRLLKRSAPQQTKHDKKVSELARQYERGGWTVSADVSGYPRPEPVGRNRHIPDLVVTKAGAKRIIEVETLTSVKKDKSQHEAFGRSAARQKRTTFQIVVA